MIINISDYISNFRQATFWVSSGQSNLTEVLWFFAFSGLLTTLGVASFLALRLSLKDSPPKRKLLTPLAWGLVILGVLGIMFGLFRIEGVGFFSAYVFWALVILATGILLVYFAFRYLKVLPNEQLRYESYLLKKKYLPKRKKKS